MKAKAFLSAFAGFFFGLIGYFILLLLDIDQPFQLAAFSGLLFALLFFPVLGIYEVIVERRYAKFEKNIISPIFYQTGTLIALNKKNVRNGKVYFCETGIVLITLDEKPYLLEEILLQNIERYYFDNIHLNVYTNDGRVFILTFPNVKEAIAALKKRNWIQE